MAQLVQIPVLSDNYVYLLHDDETALTAVVDPAVAPPVLDALDARGWTLSHILCTHHHQDHIGGVDALRRATGAKVYGNAHDAKRLPVLDGALSEGAKVQIGSLEALVMDTPGHTVGHICYWFAANQILFCGDTLFSLGCGRLFEGSPGQMWESLGRIAALPGDTQICCAHEYTQSNGRFALTVEPDTEALQARVAEVAALRADNKPTVPSLLKVELATNPFLRAGTVERFAEIRRRKDHF